MVVAVETDRLVFLQVSLFGLEPTPFFVAATTHVLGIEEALQGFPAEPSLDAGLLQILFA
jgi:hypothetical protein